MNRHPYIAPGQREGYNAPIIDVHAGTAPAATPPAAQEPKPKAAPKPKAKPAKKPAKKK